MDIGSGGFATTDEIRKATANFTGYDQELDQKILAKAQKHYDNAGINLLDPTTYANFADSYKANEFYKGVKTQFTDFSTVSYSLGQVVGAVASERVFKGAAKILSGKFLPKSFNQQT